MSAADQDLDWTGLVDGARTLSRKAQAAEKAFKAAGEPGEAPVVALQAVRALRDVAAAVPSADELARAERSLERAVADWRMGFLGRLSAAAEAAGVPLQRLTTDEVRLGRATVSLALDKGQATVCYAREALETVAADPKAIVEAARRGVAALDDDRSPEVIFDALAGAYRALLGRRGSEPGARVELVDLLPELFLARQSKAFWNKQDPRKMTAVTRAQLAFDLDRLQRGRMLERNGARIVLGTATGGSAGKKDRVLFLETGGAGGQYYLTFALRRAG